jgi:hypothetical protein
MPTLIEMRLKATWTVHPDTRQLHGLACALFEGDSTGHLGQDKPFTVQPLLPRTRRLAGRVDTAGRVAARRAPSRDGEHG